MPLLLLSAACAPPTPPPSSAATSSLARSGHQAEIPEHYRLAAHEFTYELRPLRALPLNGVEVFELRFPSPVESPHPENNTVYAEYYRPDAEGQFPCVIVLDITGGDQRCRAVIARHLAQNGIGGLFVQMAYYGPRRPPGSDLRLLSPDLDLTTAAIRQTVLDLRLATAWMESRPEVDAQGSASWARAWAASWRRSTAEMEPKLGRVALLLGGAGFVDGYWDHPKVVPLRVVYQLCGGTKDELKAYIAPIDPITRAGQPERPASLDRGGQERRDRAAAEWRNNCGRQRADSASSGSTRATTARHST